MPPYIGQPYPTTRPEHHSGRLGTPDPEYHTSPDDAEHHTSPDAEHHTSPYPEYHTLFRPNQSKNSFNYALGVLARVNPPENYVGRNNLTSLLETLERNTRHYRTSPPGYHACEEYYAEQMAQIKKLYAGLGPDQPASEEIYVEAKLIAGQARRKSAQIAHNLDRWVAMGDEARDYLALMREKHVDTTEILRKLTAHDNEVKEADIHPDRLDELVKEREALIGKLAKKYGKVPERTAVHRRVAEGIRRVTTGFRSLGKGDRHDVVLHGHEGTAYMTSRQAGRYPELTQRSRR